MKLELTEVTWLDERAEFSVLELAERSRLSEADLVELIDYGVIAPRESRALTAAKTAARLRSDFEIDVHGVALAMTLLRRIEELQAELSQLRARSAGTPI